MEVKGATNIKKLYGDKAFVVFISPPSLEVLIQRLKDRNTESPQSLRKRINRVRQEMTYENSFDYVLVNDELDVSLKEAEIITESFILGKLSS
jgi:guanylate kinase